MATSLLRVGFARTSLRAAVFHTVRPMSSATTAAGSSATVEKSKAHGSRHWSIERGLSVGFLALIPAAVFLPSAPVDYALGVIFPIHAYYGFQSFVIDYLPKHKRPTAHFLGMTALQLVTLLSVYGLYELNANDIGITNTIKKLWTLH